MQSLPAIFFLPHSGLDHTPYRARIDTLLRIIAGPAELRFHYPYIFQVSTPSASSVVVD